MKGFPFISAVLGLIKAEPRTLREIGEALDMGAVPVMRLVAELRVSGLIAPVGKKKPRKGSDANVWGFVGGEATENGRSLTRRYLMLWNGLLEADSAAAIAADLGLNENYTRLAIHHMRAAKLCRIAGWQRGRVSVPTALYQIGTGKDAPRPKAMTEQEYNRTANQRRRERKLFGLLTWSTAAHAPRVGQ